MGRRSIFPLLFIFCMYVKIIQCDELAKCYTQPVESCPLQNKCKCVKTGELSFCCHLQSYEDLVKNLECSGPRLQPITALHIYNMTTDNFNFAKMSPEFNKLISFSITNSYIRRILGRFPHTNEITCLNMSNNAFGSEWQEPLAFENLKYLARLDLSNINITRLPSIKIQVPHFWLDVSNNKKMHCDSILDLMKSCIGLKNKPFFINPNETFCLSSIGFHWFNSTEKLALSQVEIINKIFEDCPQNCSCKSYGYDMVQDTSTLHTVQVDCSYKQLSNLPENLPENTVLLNVTNNNITSIETLISDHTYKTLRYLYADENKISNILSLEGSTFIDNFLVLSLRLNQLKSIPMYILQNSFIKEFEGHIVKLGGNELQCDCSTVQSLKIWLLSNRLHIPDYDEILCDNFQYKLKVIDLDQKLACITQADWTHYMYYVIVAELSVLLLLIGKVSYDYWVFKTAGYLPWPASKMPKLPCDWVFE
ncbi:protein halfway isoform X3 [Sipha flava]|nr:protein halfway isoform X3 [Sipha flava]XP_025420321.1 protein halfway isoform X3 [Sipha flava]